MDKRIALHQPTPPDPRSVTPIKSIAGHNPAAMNLRDHPELDGMKIIVESARMADGETKPYVILKAWVYVGDAPEADNACVVVTGSENIVERMLLAISNDALPVSGTLRKSGRAWFLD